jgi:hypothetical protein
MSFLYLSLACAEGCISPSKCKDSQKGLNVDVKFFQLTDIVIPSTVSERFMENLLLVEKNLREQHFQNATVIRKETAGKVTTEFKRVIRIILHCRLWDMCCRLII